MWLDPAQRDSLALTYFFIGQGSAGYHVDVSDNPIIARPFFNVSSGAEDARLITYPNLVQGTVDITAESRLSGGVVRVSPAGGSFGAIQD